MNAPTKKIEKMIETGLSYFPSVGAIEEIVASYAFAEIGKPAHYRLTYVYDMCGNFEVEIFDTVQNLANAMRDIADLREWRKYESWQ